MPNKLEPTNSQVLEAVKELSTSVDKRFTLADNRAEEIMEAVQSLADLTEGRFKTMVTKEYLEQRLDERFARFETRMVTKDYLDDKMADLRGDLIVLTRRPERKVDTLVNVLHEKHVIDDTDVQRVCSAPR